MKFEEECAVCKSRLSHDETALSRKFTGKSDEYLCLDCLGKRFKMSREELCAWIEKFKREGCTLFL